jgi:hypothetical protein
MNLLLSLGLFAPKRRLNAKFVNELNGTAQIMTQDVAQHFVNLRRLCLASQPLAELSFNHAEDRLNV